MVTAAHLRAQFHLVDGNWGGSRSEVGNVCLLIHIVECKTWGLSCLLRVLFLPACNALGKSDVRSRFGTQGKGVASARPRIRFKVSPSTMIA